MTTETTVVGSAPANPIADPAMPDEQVAAAITDAVPGTHTEDGPTALGEQVYTAVMTAIRRERNRCGAVINEIARELVGKGHADVNAAQVARLQGDERAARELDGRGAANAGIGQYLGRFLILAVSLPPGACKKCLGQGVVPSRLAPGQGVPCPACSAPAAAPVNGVPTP